MMLIDAGPLVALAAPKDPNHTRCAELASTVTSRMVTTWPVITEAVWIGRRWPTFVSLLSGLFASRAITLHAIEVEALSWMTEYMVRYQDLRPDLADASLMYVAEEAGIDTIFTLDRRDFSVYRTSRNRALKIVP